MAILFKTRDRSQVVWKRTIYIMFFAQMMSMIGFSSVFPFLPLYVKALGTTTSISTDFYAGLAYSGQAFTMMIASPVWGFLADQWGRKAMVVRSMLGGSIILTMMAFVRSAEELVTHEAQPVECHRRNDDDPDPLPREQATQTGKPADGGRRHLGGICLVPPRRFSPLFCHDPRSLFSAQAASLKTKHRPQKM